MSPERVYLDFAASTPLDPRVLEAMLPYLRQRHGNPSSVHYWGQQAEAAVENGRKIIAGFLGCQTQEIIFTSGGSESDNLALRGVALTERERRAARHLLTTPVEHDAVLKTAHQLAEHYGFELEMLPVDADGKVGVQTLRERLREDTALVSIIYGNNEIGTINPIAELGAICRQAGVPFHTDAVQAAGQLPINVHRLNVDLMSLGAHKFYGPKGIGCLYVRQGTDLLPSQTGGSQEANRRAGTHNVPYIVGMAEALKITVQERDLHNKRYRSLRDTLLEGVPEKLEGAKRTGSATSRLPNHASFVIPDLDGNQLVAALDLAGFACSSASACKTGLPEPSRVLISIGLEPGFALGSLRVTVGRTTKPEHIERFLAELPALVERLREAPLQVQ